MMIARAFAISTADSLVINHHIPHRQRLSDCRYQYTKLNTPIAVCSTSWRNKTLLNSQPSSHRNTSVLISKLQLGFYLCSTYHIDYAIVCHYLHATANTAIQVRSTSWTRYRSTHNHVDSKVTESYSNVNSGFYCISRSRYTGDLASYMPISAREIGYS